MSETISAAEYRAITSKPKKSKYNASKTVLDGITFDSKRESEVYADLLLREKVGDIFGLVRQRAFNLIINGELVGRYTADFAFIDRQQDDKLRVIDVKGVVTRDFARVRKIIKALYQIDVEVWK